jgi:hypothetical protein
VCARRHAWRGGGLAAGLAASLLGAVFGVTKPTSRMEQETQVYSVRVPPDVRPVRIFGLMERRYPCLPRARPVLCFAFAQGSVFVIEHFGLQYQVQAPVPPSVDGTVQVRLPTAPVAQQQTQQAAQQQAQQQAQLAAQQQAQLAAQQQAAAQQQQLMHLMMIQQQQAQQQAQQRQAQQQQQQQQQQQPPGGQPGAAAGGEEWTMWQDSASGRHFYRNARTGQTMWAP